MIGRRRAGATSSVPLTERAAHLRSALDIGGKELDPPSAEKARGVVQRTEERWALKGGRTVVALAGATGSGKSSLFNALVGEDVSVIGPRRPTTAEAAAAVWGEEGAGELGFYSPHSWWPLFLAASAAVTALGLVFGWWLVGLGLIFVLLSLGGFLFEYYRGAAARQYR